MEARFIQKREQAHRDVVSADDVTVIRGFFDTNRGLVLTTDSTLRLVKHKSCDYYMRKLASDSRAITKEHAFRCSVA